MSQYGERTHDIHNLHLHHIGLLWIFQCYFWCSWFRKNVTSTSVGKTLYVILTIWTLTLYVVLNISTLTLYVVLKIWTLTLYVVLKICTLTLYVVLKISTFLSRTISPTGLIDFHIKAPGIPHGFIVDNVVIKVLMNVSLYMFYWQCKMLPW